MLRVTEDALCSRGLGGNEDSEGAFDCAELSLCIVLEREGRLG